MINCSIGYTILVSTVHKYEVRLVNLLKYIKIVDVIYIWIVPKLIMHTLKFELIKSLVTLCVASGNPLPGFTLE